MVNLCSSQIPGDVLLKPQVDLKEFLCPYVAL